MIYWIEWQFGSWKTSLAAYIARIQALETAKLIAKNISHQSKSFIISNIKFNEYEIKNYTYFEDDKFLEVLRTINFLNDVERELYYTEIAKSTLKQRQREKFTRFYLFYDESTAIQSARGTVKTIKSWDNSQEEYIMQNRKNFENIYVIWADWNQNDKSLRRHVEWWYRVKPLPWFFKKLPYLENIWIIERHKKDDEGNIAMEKYLAKDERWDYITKMKPIQENIDWFYKPLVWRLYDDLHKNIKDPDKYKINEDILKWFIWENKLLLDQAKKILPDLQLQLPPEKA